MINPLNSPYCSRVVAPLKNGVRNIVKNIYTKLGKNENYVEPLKTEFSSYVSAQNYARGRCVQALESPSPYEHIVIINQKNNKVVSEFTGHNTSATVSLWGRLSMPKHAVKVHGHPTLITKEGVNMTTPVSFPDFINLNSKGKQMFAYNQMGQYSALIKKPGYKKLNDEQISKFAEKRLNMLIETYTQKYKDILPKELQSPEEYMTYMNKLSNYYKQRQDMPKLLEMSRLFRELPKTEDGIQTMHRFWLENADKMGLKYCTNYSYLK